MSDSAYKNLRLSDFPVPTDVKATEDALQILLDAEAAFNGMLEHAAAHGQRPVMVKLYLIDRHEEQRRLLLKAVAASEGDTETIKEFYATQK